MNRYKMEVLTTAAPNWTNDDLLGVIASTVSAVAELDNASVKGTAARGMRSVKVTFRVHDDDTARVVAKQARASVPGSADTLLAMRTHTGYRPVTTD